MNQEFLIVFTLFLLITILLMLLLSDAKEKGKRIRVLADISGNAESAGIMENIRAFLDNLSSENSFDFTLADVKNPENFHPSDHYSVILRFQPSTLPDQQNKIDEIWVDPASPQVIWIATDPSLFDDPDFSSRVRDSILQVASLQKKQG